MQFLKEIREHLKDFETEASEEMHKFIDFLHTKYQEPGPAVVPPPAPLAVPVASTYIAPIVSSPVEEEPAPAVEAVVTEPQDVGPNDIAPVASVVTNTIPDPNVIAPVVSQPDKEA